MSNECKGKLYVLEGIDNVGKTTIINKVYSSLKNKNIPCSTYSFPGKEPNTLGNLVYDFHHNKNKYINFDINNISLQLLHVASHIDLLSRCIIPDLKQGKIVLLDRFWWSAYAYGIANGINKKQLKAILEPEMQIIKNLKIDKIFLVKRDIITKEYDEFTAKNIIAAYEDLAVKQSRSVHIVYNNKDISDVVSEIVNVILEKREIEFDGQLSLFSDYSINLAIYPIPSKIYDTYWKFAAQRQNLFFSKMNLDAYPPSDDPILSKYKFTNAYRASDRVSQYLIKNVIYNNKNLSPEDIIFRIILFKLFNKIETWETLEKKLGEITYQNYNFNIFDEILSEQLLNDIKIYSAAYIMPSGKSTFHYTKKHQNNLTLLEVMMKDGIAKNVASAKSLHEVYELLLQYPTLGEFLAFQLSIDINYSELCDFDEMSFVKAGPGAKNGIHKCFVSTANYNYEEIIRYMAVRQQEEFERLGLQFQDLWGRPLQLIDCQNLFCETDKYSRVAYPEVNGESGRTRIKQLYKPSNREAIEYFYPPKWNINQNIVRR